MNEILKTENGWYIRFAHEQGTWFQKLRSKRREVEITITRRTVCQVVSGDRQHEELITQGVALCSPTNNYDAEIGRQVSLFEAMKMLPKGSHDGRLIKNAYLDRPGAKPWMLDKNGHPLTRFITERTKEAKEIYGTHRHIRRTVEVGYAHSRSTDREPDSDSAYDYDNR